MSAAVATAPAPGDADVLQLLALNHLSGTPHYLPYEDRGYGAQWCHISSKHCAMTAGGRRVHGWALWRWDVPEASPPETILFGEHHSVWERPDGALIDVTPPRYGAAVLFVRDDAAVLAQANGVFQMRTDLTNWSEIPRVLAGSPIDSEFYPLTVSARPDLVTYCQGLGFDPMNMSTDPTHG